MFESRNAPCADARRRASIVGMNFMTNKNGKRPSAALVVAILALVMAMGGSAVAASLITSKQIKDGTIQPVDLSKQARAVLAAKASDLPGPQGPVGAKGDKGDAGAQGAQGERGPSDAVADFQSGAADWSASAAEVVSVQLPAGDYVVSADTTADNDSKGDAEVSCDLELGGTVVARAQHLVLAGDGGAGERQTVAVTGAGTLAAAGTAALRCESSVMDGHWDDSSITAIHVAAATTTD
jgi:hypothetical protein